MVNRVTNDPVVETIPELHGIQLSDAEIRFLLWRFDPSSPIQKLPQHERTNAAAEKAGISNEDAECFYLGKNEAFNQAFGQFMYRFHSREWQFLMHGEILIDQLLEKSIEPVLGLELDQDKVLKAYRTKVDCLNDAIALRAKIATQLDAIAPDAEKVKDGYRAGVGALSRKHGGKL
jgi:hypothetical protein